MITMIIQILKRPILRRQLIKRPPFKIFWTNLILNNHNNQKIEKEEKLWIWTIYPNQAAKNKNKRSSNNEK